MGVSDSIVTCCRSVAERPMISEGGAKLHFVDDRFETVEAIAADPYLSALPRLQTYFATWCAAAERIPCHWTECSCTRYSMRWSGRRCAYLTCSS